MSATIITGYTGTKHITPALDASVFRSMFGQGEYILQDGDKCVGTMPDINTFTVASGNISLQGYQVQIAQESLSVDTCATGYKRIDLVALRYNHDIGTQIDSVSLAIIKGTEVDGVPTEPSYNSGEIEAGVNAVDMILYKIELDGSTVTFTKVALTLDMSLSGYLGPDSITPLMDGTAARGSSNYFARGDHVHPSDTSRVPTTRKVNNKALSADISLVPSDIGITSVAVTIATGDWSSNTATKSATGVKTNNTVVVAPAPASIEEYVASGIVCTAQGSGTLTFKCTTPPTTSVTVNVLVIG